MKDNPSYFQHAGSNAPVERVSWENCQTFCRKTGLCMPTEAEWEYVCRSGMNGMSYIGDFTIAWYGVNSTGWTRKPYNPARTGTHPVGQKTPNAWGCYDMIGNVWEWCQDRAEWKGCVITNTYEEGMVDPVSTRGDRCVVRGGGWDSYARNCRCARRGSGEPTARDFNFGLRLVSK